MTLELRRGPNTAWIDSIATSYGMLGVRIGLVEDDDEHVKETKKSRYTE
jgi:hypothetical protein